MKKYLLLFLISFLSMACKKAESEYDTYGYETECDECDINYVDDLGTTVYVNGHKGTWKKDFPRSVFTEMKVTVTARQSNSNTVSAHIIKDGKRLVSKSGNSSVTVRHIVKSSGSTKPVSGICGAPTQKGGPCQRKVSGGGRCWQHK
ncbi:MAG: hypothetical protein WC589_04975 [Sphingobacterium sp.]|uniref:hypothetical protein n=1 Tax=Sphingobacterium TaxID=28453 RepID=UPI0013589912|nr:MULTISPECIES: hypothetical protein [unclassified Sphingobacterium]